MGHSCFIGTSCFPYIWLWFDCLSRWYSSWFFLLDHVEKIISFKLCSFEKLLLYCYLNRVFPVYFFYSFSKIGPFLPTIMVNHRVWVCSWIYTLTMLVFVCFDLGFRWLCRCCICCTSKFGGTLLRSFFVCMWQPLNWTFGAQGLKILPLMEFGHMLF